MQIWPAGRIRCLRSDRVASSAARAVAAAVASHGWRCAGRRKRALDPESAQHHVLRRRARRRRRLHRDALHIARRPHSGDLGGDRRGTAARQPATRFRDPVLRQRPDRGPAQGASPACTVLCAGCCWARGHCRRIHLFRRGRADLRPRGVRDRRARSSPPNSRPTGSARSRLMRRGRIAGSRQAPSSASWGWNGSDIP